MLRRKLLCLIKVAAAPENELVFPLKMGDLDIFSIEVVNDGSDFVVNIWDDFLEWQLHSSELTHEQMEDIYHQLTQLIFN